MTAWNIAIKTAATLDPVTLAEAKLFCKVDGNEDDALVTSLIASATAWAQEFTGRQFVNATRYLRLDSFPTTIVVPYPTLSSVTSIKYYDTNGTQQTLAAANYTVRTAEEPGQIVEAYNCTWPATRDIPDAILIEYISGYGATASTVPDAIRTAIKMLVAHWYENRQPVNIGNIVTPIDTTVEALLSPYRVGWMYE